MAVRCEGCGLESTLDGTMVLMAVPGREPALCCPACCAEFRARRKVVIYCFFAVLGVVGLAGTALALPGNFGWFMLGVSLFYGFQVLSVVPHELSHAVTAWVLRMRVSRITIGAFGPVVGRLRVLGVRLEIRAVPAGGSITAWPRGPFLAGIREFVCVLAGPLSHLAMVVAAMAACSWFQPDSVAMWAAGIFIFSNLFQAAVNFWPHSSWTEAGVYPSDGLRLLQIMWRRDAGADRDAARVAWEALYLRGCGDYDAATRLIEHSLNRWPESGTLRCCRGLLLLDRREFQPARDVFRDLAARESDPAEEAAYLSGAAWTDLLWGKNLDEADHLSEEAYRRYPWAPFVAGVRGAVLAEQGRFLEAEPMLRRGLRGWNDEPTATAALSACLAMVQAWNGEPSQARRALKRARRIDPTCPVLEWVAARILRIAPGQHATDAAPTTTDCD